MTNPFGQFKMCMAMLESGQPCPSVASVEMVAVCGAGHVYHVVVCSRCYGDPDQICAEDKNLLRIRSAVEIAVKDGRIVRGERLK